MPSFRYQFLRLLHCWLALPFALLLILQGLTGTIITWKHEVDAFLNPGLLRVTAPENGNAVARERLTLSILVEQAKQHHPTGKLTMLELPEKENEALVAWFKEASDQNKKPGTKQMMINPYTGTMIGERVPDKISFSRSQFVPSLMSWHRNFLGSDNGKLLVSVNGIVLAIIALSGIYLWWPVWRLKAWWQAITISHQGPWKRFNFRLHRATGFYSTPILLMLAITGIYFNQPDWITPIVKQVVSVTADSKEVKASTENNFTDSEIKNLNPDQIIDLAQKEFPMARVTRISFPEKTDGRFEVRLHQPGELREGSGATRVTVDALHGKIIKIRDPLKASKEALFYSYFFPLHSGEIFGTIGKIIISFVGLLPLLFAISGTLIWLRRR